MRNKSTDARPDQLYWHCYHDAATLSRAAALRRVHHVPSTGVDLHVDVYAQQDQAAPVLVLNHGGGGYGGLFVGLALAFHARGYTVVVPDQKGQGRSGGAQGDFTVAESVQNIVDVALWARSQFGGNLFLSGGSIGGGLTYAAAAALHQHGLPPAAIVCLNLYDFGDPHTGLGFTRLSALAQIPGMAVLCKYASLALASLLPGLRLPYRPLARFRHMLDERDQVDLPGGFYTKWQADPCTLRTVTARYFASMLATPFCIPLESNTDIPVLVINQKRDRMVSPQLTLDGYQRLAGPKKYVEIDCGHFSLQEAFIACLADLGDDWLQKHGQHGQHRQHEQHGEIRTAKPAPLAACLQANRLLLSPVHSK
ncbi:alpha/beta hydrolase [Undibacterium sp. TJN19]|uniref:alpha/beta hydrolase n=1 Tax=Undibacterium sp. TJN19 TaxID=3413055 RepID=UPI003BF204ED